MDIDASVLVMGRLAAFVAKQALLGKKVRVFNCEKIIVSGKKAFLLPYFRHKLKGRTYPFKGPFFSKMADRFFRKAVKGMLPHGGSEESRGRAALSRVECYLGVPVRFNNPSLIKIDSCVLKDSTQSAMSLSELLGALGAK